MTLRIAYAGIIQIIAQSLTLITGLIFVAIVTRNITVEEFGLWQTLGSFVGVLLLPLAPLNYWTLRYSARGDEVGKTSFLAAIFAIPVFIVAYVIIVFSISSRIDAVMFYVLIYCVQIPALCIWEPSRTINRTYRPEFLGYSTILLELGKIAAAYITISILKLGITGAIISLAIGQVFQLILILYIIKPKLKGTFKISILKKWYNSWWIPTAHIGASRLLIADSIVTALVLGSTVLVGLFQASRTFTLIIRYSDAFIRVLYPKLIRDKSSEDITLTIRLHSLIIIPIAAGVFMLAEPLLGILGEQYIAGSVILRVLTIVAIIEGIEFFMWNIITGTEKIDDKIENLDYNKLKDSWLFKLPRIDLLRSIIYLSVLASTMYLFGTTMNLETLGIYWAVILIIFTLPITIYKIKVARDVVKFQVPKMTIFSYIVAGMVMSIFLYIYQEFIPRTVTSTIPSVIYLIMPTIGGAIVYFVIVLLLDSFTRKIFQDIINQITKKI